MYTGRITEVATVVEVELPSLVIEAPRSVGELTAGGSVSINGAHLAARELDAVAGRFSVEITPETLARTTFSELAVGAQVNIELPLRVGDPIDGHLVQGNIDAIGKVARVDVEVAGAHRIWIRPPKRFLDEIAAKGSVAVDGVSLTVAEILNDRFSVALVPTTLRETTLGLLAEDQRVNLESDLFVKTARDLHQAARVMAGRTLANLPWAGALSGSAGIEKCAAALAAGDGVMIYDADREAEADVIFAGSMFRPESMVFLLTAVCGHTTVPCDPMRLAELEIPPMPGAGDRHGTAYHVSVDLAAGDGTGVSAVERAATIRRLAHPDARPADFLRPGHVFPLARRPAGLRERRGHTEASLALCDLAGLPPVAAICEVMGPDGLMLTGAAVERFALAWSLPLISVDDLVAAL